MSGDDESSWQDHLPDDGVPEQQPALSAETAFGADPWGDGYADPFADPTANLFSAEIENVNPSDWNLDAALIWGDDGEQAADDGSIGIDFPM